VTLLPPDVQVYRRGLTESKVSDEWSQTARASITDALMVRFGQDERFILRQVDPAQAEEDLVQVQYTFARIAERPAEHTQDGIVQCLLDPLPTLSAIGRVDAWLLVYARDRIKTTGRHVGEVAAGVGVFAAGTVLAVGGLLTLSPPLFFSGAALAGGSQGAVYYKALKPGENALAMCLVDSKTAETLWFDRRRFGSVYDLQNRDSAEALVTKLYERFRKLTPP
jgi:hypothetical protein